MCSGPTVKERKNIRGRESETWWCGLKTRRSVLPYMWLAMVVCHTTCQCCMRMRYLREKEKSGDERELRGLEGRRVSWQPISGGSEVREI